MKKVVSLIALMLVVTSITAQEINWVSLEEAVELQKKNPKKIMIDAYTNWCGPCKMLDKNTFQKKDVADYVNKYYYAVKFNAEGNETINFKGNTFSNPGYNPANANRRNSQHELSAYFSVRSYPTILFLDEKGEFLSPVIGYKTPQQLEVYLKLFKENAHTSMKTQEDFSAYYSAFKPEFSN
ncbi:thioredoxin family protein [Xanthomarina sp. F2636L]|uniref:thioredoxin family protein n=1 Tax=Xanthomarina sp. F2636L TaxID=2996018 RepID=UPI00225DE45F|nr:thioredoxin fold domain-containing protein [Xanthomarina sp. F2636L]MCX7550865.1 thioredoxin fold domain-containing protein [Xanthomarina sp. F2636L]